ncbi:hypothetical protein QFC24_003161 [Naganishia onofrii]|uniref:Uncharacterized protein n=1 Tax=Naganishia onofrii TaxID=1851511 RepID=A0ACC2XLE6_9TREE|nr:hypothetical protein QFC24_003161 [Naganishia onofrii]
MTFRLSTTTTAIYRRAAAVRPPPTPLLPLLPRRTQQQQQQHPFSSTPTLFKKFKPQPLFLQPGEKPARKSKIPKKIRERRAAREGYARVPAERAAYARDAGADADPGAGEIFPELDEDGLVGLWKRIKTGKEVEQEEEEEYVGARSGPTVDYHYTPTRRLATSVGEQEERYDPTTQPPPPPSPSPSFRRESGASGLGFGLGPRARLLRPSPSFSSTSSSTNTTTTTGGGGETAMAQRLRRIRRSLVDFDSSSSLSPSPSPSYTTSQPSQPSQPSSPSLTPRPPPPPTIKVHPETTIPAWKIPTQQEYERYGSGSGSGSGSGRGARRDNARYAATLAVAPVVRSPSSRNGPVGERAPWQGKKQWQAQAQGQGQAQVQSQTPRPRERERDQGMGMGYGWSDQVEGGAGGGERSRADEEGRRTISAVGRQQQQGTYNNSNSNSSQHQPPPPTHPSPPTQPTARPPNRWEPTKRISLPAMAGLRDLHASDPARFTGQVLAEKFGISREAVGRILRSRFRDGGVGAGAGAGD